MKLFKEFAEYFRHPAVKMMLWVRVVCYFLIYVTPFWGMVLAVYLDAWDFDYVSKYGITKPWYDRIDTVIDYLEYIVLIPVVYFSPIWLPYMLFLAWRTIGMLLYYFFETKKSIFVLFPNVSEYLALSAFFFSAFNIPLNAASTSFILFIVALKIVQELELHLVQYNLNPTEQEAGPLIRAWRRFNENLIR